MTSLLARDLRAEWLNERRTGIGASDAPAVLGMSPWASPFSVWLDKTDPLDDGPTSEAMEWGLRLEPAMAEAWADATGMGSLPVVHDNGRPRIVRHPRHSWMICTPDRVASDGNPVELKTSNPFDDGWDPDVERIPDHVRIQQQHEIAVMDAARCYGAVLIGGSKFRTWVVERDDALIGDLVAIEERFWRDHVLANIPPPIDGHHATSERIHSLFPTSVPDAEVELPPEAARLIRELVEARRAAKLFNTAADEACNNLLTLLGEASYGCLNGIRVVSAKSYERKGYEVKPCTVRPVRITKGWTE